MGRYSRTTFYLIIVILLAISLNGFSVENINAQRISQDQTLLNSNVNTIFKDSRGFMWFGTENGLYQYDGYSFLSYYHDKNDSLSIDNDNIIHINEDSDGFLWIGTRVGLNIFNPKSEKFKRIPLNWVTDICKSSYGGFWIGTREGLFRTCENPKLEEWAKDSGLPVRKYGDQKFIQYKKEGSNTVNLNDNGVKCLMEDSNGNLWVGTDHEGAEPGAIHLLKIDKKEQYPPIFKKYYFADTQNEGHVCKWPEEFLEDINGNIWIVSWWEGLIKLDPQTDKIYNYHFKPNWNGENENIMAIEADNDGNLFLGTFGDGLIKINREELNKKNPEFTYYNLSENKEILKDDRILSLLYDHSGSLWIGTRGSGIIKSQSQFLFKKLTDQKAPGKTNKSVSFFAIDENENIFQGYNDGTFSSRKSKPEKWEHYSLGLETQIRFISVYSENELLVGCKAGFFIFNTETQKKYRFFESFNVSDSLKNTPVCNVIDLPNNENVVVFTEFFGLGLVSKNKYKSLDFAFEFISGIYKASNNNYWVYRPWGDPIVLDSTFQQLIVAETTSIAEDKSTWNVTEDPEGNIWAATRKGITVFDPNNYKYYQLFERDGLISNYTSAVVADKKGFIWASGRGGIVRINPKTKEIIKFTDHDNVSLINFTDKVGAISHKGNIFFGSEEGTITFNPDNIRVNNHIPPVFITKFSIHNKPIHPGTEPDGRKILEKSISYTDTISLNYKSNVLGFEFTSLDYNAPQKNMYAYKMEGVDDEWVHVNYQRRFASYAGLQHGRYVFRVRATNDSGIWNETGDSIVINILPPWWLTIWFKITCVIFILLLIWLFIYLRLKSLKQSKKQLEINVAEKTAELVEKNLTLTDIMSKKDKFLSIMAHDLRNPIGTINEFVGAIIDDYDDFTETELKKSLNLFKKRLEDTYNLLENLLVWGNRLNNKKTSIKIGDTYLHHEIKKAVNIYNPNDKNISFEVNCQPDIIIRADTDMLQFVLRNLISNAVKFSFSDGLITLNAVTKTSYCEISITDQGTGMKKSQIEQFNEANELNSIPGTKGEKGTGLGLLNCKTFILDMNGKMSIESDVEKKTGTRIVIELPLSN